MQELRMTKELAEKIMLLTVEGQRNFNEKYHLQKDLDCYDWDGVQLRALQFLMQEKAVAHV